MSIKLMTQVWSNAPVKGNELLTLLALADWANDDGTSIYPSISTIAKKTRVSESTARRTIQALADKGIVSVEQGGGRFSNHYSINVSQIDTPVKLTPPPLSK